MEKSAQDPELPLLTKFCSGEALDRVDAQWFDRRDPYLGTGTVRDIQESPRPQQLSSATRSH